MTKLYLVKSYPEQYFRHTVDYILKIQQADGSIPWFEDGYTDPWDHVEAAMGLSIGGEFLASRKAFRWLKETQETDGGWWAAYKNGEVEDGSRKESNFVAYVATGLWHYYLISKDLTFLEEMWPTLEKAISFVLSMQSEYGEVYWAKDTKTGINKDALITGNSSIFKSLECALNIASTLGNYQNKWSLARTKVQHALLHHPERFDRTWESKERFSMDWFYPILTGVITGANAKTRLEKKWEQFVEKGLGCRCVSDEPWVTVAESCELVMALIAAGEKAKATEVFSWLHDLRCDNGAYWTGYVFKDQCIWPEEKPTWTAAAVLLAADALTEASPACKLFSSINLLDATQEAESIHHFQLSE